MATTATAAVPCKLEERVPSLDTIYKHITYIYIYYVCDTTAAAAAVVYAIQQYIGESVHLAGQDCNQLVSPSPLSGIHSSTGTAAVAVAAVLLYSFIEIRVV